MLYITVSRIIHTLKLALRSPFVTFWCRILEYYFLHPFTSGHKSHSDAENNFGQRHIRFLPIAESTTNTHARNFWVFQDQRKGRGLIRPASFGPLLRCPFMLLPLDRSFQDVCSLLLGLLALSVLELYIYVSQEGTTDHTAGWRKKNHREYARCLCTEVGRSI